MLVGKGLGVDGHPDSHQSYEPKYVRGEERRPCTSVRGDFRLGHVWPLIGLGRRRGSWGVWLGLGFGRLCRSEGEQAYRGIEGVQREVRMGVSVACGGRGGAPMSFVKS